MASQRTPRRRDRRRDLRRGSDLRIGVVGSSADVTRLSDLSRTAILSFPAGAKALDDVVRQFLADTAAVRTPPRVESAGSTERPTRTGVVLALGYTFLLVAFIASIAAAAATLPVGRHDVEQPLAYAVSTGAAYTVLVTAIVGCALPPWGRADSRALAWLLHLVGAVCLTIGLVAALSDLGRDVDEVGTGAWTGWFAANVAALVAVVVATIVRKGHADRWSPLAGHTPPKAQRTGHRQYVSAVRHPLSRAARAMDRFVVAHPTEAAAVDEAWRTGVDAAQTTKQISGSAAGRARSISAYRWCLELAAAVPDAIDDAG